MWVQIPRYSLNFRKGFERTHLMQSIAVPLSVAISCTIVIILVHCYTQVFQNKSASATLRCENKKRIILNETWHIPGPSQCTEQINNVMIK